MKRTSLLWMTAVLVAVTAAVRPAAAGDLNPPPSALSNGVPAPTMKTLDQIPPTWDQTLSSLGPLMADGVTRDACNSPRFRCVLANNEAVLDRETGLVWERAPAATRHPWDQAVDFRCPVRGTGNRRGWRLPTAEELLSLLGAGGGHPFISVQASYWTSTVSVIDNTYAASVLTTPSLDAGGDAGGFEFLLKTDTHFVWCVRGGSARSR